jgi:putative addiction module component (TIGR02574 family)
LIDGRPDLHSGGFLFSMSSGFPDKHAISRWTKIKRDHILAAKKKKNKKKMNALQLSIELSFEQLTAIVKRLSPDDREELMIRMWQDDKPKKITKAEKKFLDRRIREVEKHPERAIPLEVAIRHLRSNK